MVDWTLKKQHLSHSLWVRIFGIPNVARYAQVLRTATFDQYTWAGWKQKNMTMSLLTGRDAFVANGLHKGRIFPKSNFLLLLFCVPLRSYEVVLTKSFVLVWRRLRCTWSHRDRSAGTEKAFNAWRWRWSSSQTEGWTHVWSATLWNSHKKEQTLGALYATPHTGKSLHATSCAAASLPDQRESSMKGPSRKWGQWYRAELKRYFRSVGLVSLPVVSGEVAAGTEIPGGLEEGTTTPNATIRTSSALRWAAMRATLMVHSLWGAKSRDGVHKPQLWKRKEGVFKEEIELVSCAYQPNALLLGQARPDHLEKCSI